MMLTPKQEAFCQAYVAKSDGAAAYRSSYNVRATTSAKSIDEAASKMLADPKIARRIEELRSQADAAAAATRDPTTGVGTLTRMFDLIVTAATADPRELIGLRVGACRHCWGVDHAYHWRQREYLEALAAAEKGKAPLPDASGGLDFNATREPCETCPECHGEGIERVVPRDTNKLSPGALALYGGAERKRDGSIKIHIADRGKFIEMGVRMMGGFTDNVKLGGAVGQMVQLITAEDSPEDAARKYREMCAGLALK